MTILQLDNLKITQQGNPLIAIFSGIIYLKTSFILDL